MQFSQSAIFQLVCASFLAGLILALFCDVLYIARLWLKPPAIRYTVPAIQRIYARRIKESVPKKHRGLRAAVFLHDLLLCLVGAITLILLLYRYNNGAFRAAAPLCAAVGFGMWFGLVSKGMRAALQWLTFCIEMAIYTLIMPLRRLLAWGVRAYKKNAQKRRLARLVKERKRYTKHVLRSIDKNVEGLLPIYERSRMQKGERFARKTKKAI